MIIVKGKLRAVDPEDIDENGKVVIPKEVEVVEGGAFDGCENVTEIEFEEGTHTISDYCFSFLHSLKSIKFPKSLRVVGKQIFSKKAEVNFKLRSLPQISTNSFGERETMDYVKYCLDKSEELIASSNVEDIEKALEYFDSVIRTKHDIKDEEILKKFDNVTYLILNKLSEKIDGKEIGKILIEKRFKDNKELTESLLIYDAYKVYQDMGLEKEFKLPHFYTIQQKALMTVDNELIMDIPALKAKAKKDFKEEYSVRNYNLMIMFVTRHEISHLHQKTRSIDSENKEDVIEFLTSQVQQVQDGYYSANPSGHVAPHEFLPDEIGADLMGYKQLGKDMVEDYGFSEEDAKEFIEPKIEKRMQMVYDRYGIGPEDDYVRVIMEEALASDRLSSAERTKLTEVYEMYMSLNSEHTV